MMNVEALIIKPDREKKERINLKEVKLLAGFGPEGDAFGGPGDRELTLIGSEDLERLEADRERGLCIRRFAANIIISGSSAALKKGATYRIGEAEILITSVTKKCYEECLLRTEDKRICLLPSVVRFASIEKSGKVSIGDGVE